MGSKTIEGTTIVTHGFITNYITDVVNHMGVVLDTSSVSSSVYNGLKDDNTRSEFEDVVISCLTDMAIKHRDYSRVASWILIDRLHRSTHSDYGKVLNELCHINTSIELLDPSLNITFVNFARLHIDFINECLDYDRDYNISVFGYRTLEKLYLKKHFKGDIIERPQHTYMRVAIAIHCSSDEADSIKLYNIKETYDAISLGYYTHATPTIFNAGTNRQQLASCFLLGVNDDMESIGTSWKECAVISKYAGGIGIHVTRLRCSGSYIKATQGEAAGLRVLPVYNEIARYANQGGKRAGSIAVYIEPWHGDILYFLELKKNTGAETERTRDLFLGLMVNDIFMRRIESDEKWSLMCPSVCPDLIDKYGNEFDRVYESYESRGMFIKQIDARELWFKIMESQIETGVPYILFKDAINEKSNQKNIGVINGSNLCAEIVEYSSESVYSSCNLASICLPKYVDIGVDGVASFNFEKLYGVSRLVCRNMNNIIDISFYPVDNIIRSNINYRPIGVGVQGLADVFAMFKVPFDSEKARSLNKSIFETIYYGVVFESNQLAIKHGHYPSFKGSPFSEGTFQFDMWSNVELSGKWDWDILRRSVTRYGLRNSLLTSCMPTASTSQIMGNNECIEPYTTNIYMRSTIAGDFYVVNKYLMDDLIELGLWDDNMVDLIKYYEGSIQKISRIPQHIRELYRTAFEIPLKSIIQMSIDRAPFIDQTQSLNIFIDRPNYVKLNSALFYGWKGGLKTGMYYLRSKPASEASKFGVDIESMNKLGLSDNKVTAVCSTDSKDCLYCSA